MGFSPRSINVGQEGRTYLDHREDNADRTANGLRWRATQDILGDVQGIDGHVQRGKDVVLPYRSLGI